MPAYTRIAFKCCDIRTVLADESELIEGAVAKESEVVG